MTKKQRISLTLLSVLLSAALILSGVTIWQELSDRQKEKEAFDTLAELIQTEENGPENNAEENESPDCQEDDTQADAADVPTQTRNLAPLFEQNSECIGWICIPDTEVDYPVMYTSEQPQKYLRLDFYGQYSVSGVPFLEGRCSLEGDHLIIYGHNMKNGTMFGSLKQYTGPTFPGIWPLSLKPPPAVCSMKYSPWPLSISMTIGIAFLEWRMRRRIRNRFPVLGRNPCSRRRSCRFTAGSF